MSKAPAFQWVKIQLVQVADDLMDVKDPASEGIYFRVLRWLWSNGPQTRAEIQRKCKESFAELEHVFNTRSTDVEPLLSIRWIEDQREKAETGREKWQKAGKASAEARRSKSKKKNKRSTNEERTLNECSTSVEHSTSTSYSTSVQDSGKEQARAPVQTSAPPTDPRFEALWLTYERNGSKGKALAYWHKLPEEDRAAIEAKVDAYVKSTPGGDYRYNLEGWINPAERRWEKPLRNPKGAGMSAALHSADVPPDAYQE